MDYFLNKISVKNDQLDISKLDSPDYDQIKKRIYERKSMLDNNDQSSLGETYCAVKKLGSGAFAEVYLAEHVDGGYVAMKMEDATRITSRLIDEYKIYRNLRYKKMTKSIPKVYDFISTDSCNIMCMQLLGPSIEDIFKKSNKKLNISTVIKLGINLLNIIEEVHNCGFIHRDIKPHNFMVSRKKTDEQIYIVDFGLSRKWRSRTGKHIPFRNGRSLIGTARYVSINTHMGIEPSRRDDLESICYMLIYLLKGRLPWQGLKKQDQKSSVKIIGEKKKEIKIQDLCLDIPKCFEKMLIYCRALDFDENPDYDQLRDYFYREVRESKIILEYQWL